MRWILAFTVSILGLALWFLISRACLSLWYSSKWLVILSLPWIFVFLVIGLRGWKRVVIPSLILTVGIISLMPHFNPVPNGAIESGAVGALVRIRTAIERNRSRSVAAIIGDVLSKQDPRLQRPYRFTYEGVPNGYQIGAVLTPQARSCGCVRNFVIGNDGVVHYTLEPHPATQTDPVVDIPPALEGRPSH